MADGHQFDAAADLAPHNVEAEQALLGAVLTDNETLHRVGDHLREEHFYDPVHGRIFAAAAALVQRGDLADAITLAPMGEQDEGLKALGGADYLVELMAAGVSTASAPDYARLVYDLALRRSLVRVGGEIERDARVERATQATALVEDAERKLFDLAETGSVNRGFVPFADALHQSIKMAAAAYERDGGLSGVSTGFSDLDHKLGGLHESDLIIIAGRPSMGKTAIATNMAFHIAKRHRTEKDEATGEDKTVDGGVVAFYSLEMSSEQLATRLLAEHSDVPSHLIRQGRIEPEQFNRLVEASNELNSRPLYIDDTGGLSIGALCARARRLKRTVGLDVLIVDYLQLITTGGKRHDNRVQEVSEVTQALKALAKELSVPVIALSQLSRAVESRDDKRPQLSDLRESGSIEQDADVVMFVYREEYYAAREEPKSKKDSGKSDDIKAYQEWEDWIARVAGKAELIISKQRHGPIGAVELAFDASITKFSDLAQPDRFVEHAAPSPARAPSLKRIPQARLSGPRFGDASAPLFDDLEDEPLLQM